MKRILACILTVLVMCSAAVFPNVNAAEAEISETVVSVSRDDNYFAYLERYSKANKAEKTVRIEAADYSKISADSGIKTKAYAGKKAALIWESEQGYADYSVKVPENALYALKFEYSSIEHKNLDLLFSIEVDGAYPFYEARKLSLDKIYEADGPITQNSAGDDISPKLTQSSEWTVSSARNENYDDEILLYLSEGSHNLRLRFYQEPIAISAIILSASATVPSYAEYAAQYSDTYPEAEAKCYEGEAVARQSSTLNLLHSDQSSSKTSPYSYLQKKLNVVGGANWSMTGQWLEWDIKAETAGWYYINMRYSQSYAKGVPSLRRMYINGEVPFAEANALEFAYCENWDWFSVTDANGKPLPVWLKEGNNTLRLQVVSGDILDIVRKTEDIIFELNDIYRKIIMITGSNPDTYRDYALEEQIPDLEKIFKQKIAELEEMYAYFGTLSKNANSASILSVLAEQLKSFLNRPATIVERISAFSSNIGSLSAWAAELKSHPLDIDYICISSNTSKPDINDGFFEAVLREIKLFLSSFSAQYASDALSKGDYKDQIDVWMGGGRDQASVVKRIVEEDFETQYKTKVNLKLVTTNLIQAFLAGASPDCMIQVARGTPVDLALRGALLDLSQFSDFTASTKQFQKTAMDPYMLNGGYYGMPDSQSFYMMFYRTDILSELGLQPPETWDEFIAAIEVIQRNNMMVGIPYSGVDSAEAVTSGIGAKNIFSALLLQSGGSFFNEDLSGTALTQENAKKSFRTWTQLYSEYGLDITYNFFNRFRTGEMPLAIELYTSYNQLSIAAPEISGLWEMTAIPGTQRKDGKIDRSQGASGTATVIPITTKNPQAAWSFVKFWTGADAQTRYAADIEALLGVGGRYAPANQKAFENMPWTTNEVKAIKTQWDSIKEVHNIPGGYYLVRGLDNAFRDVVYNGEDPYRSLAAWDKEINAEIARKREEFHLD